MNNKLRANVAKMTLYFTINQCKKGVLFTLKSDKIGRFYS
jgi:hypothetical protein